MSTTKLNRSDVLNKLMEVREMRLPLQDLDLLFGTSPHQTINLKTFIIGVVWAVLYRWD